MSDARRMTVLFVSTLAFMVCFAVWMMFGVTGIPIRDQLKLGSTQFGLLTATPVLTGALFRLPLGLAAAPLFGFVVDSTGGDYALGFRIFVGAFVASALLLPLVRVPAPEARA